MIRRAVVAVGIFTVLFFVAWWANEINEQRYYVDEQNGQIQLFIADEDNRFDRFGPREYIKIKR